MNLVMVLSDFCPLLFITFVSVRYCVPFPGIEIPDADAEKLGTPKSIAEMLIKIKERRSKLDS